MPVARWLVSSMCAGLLVACSQPSHPTDVTKVFAIKTSFGSDYRVSTKGPTDIDPKLVREPKLPPNVTFDPPDCDKLATEQRLPTGTQGKMASTSAEGKGNQLVAIAVNATQQVPFDPSLSEKCKHVSFTAGNVTGSIDVIDAPQINGVQTTGRHRQFQINARGKERSSELYTFAAYFGSTVVMVDASPVVRPRQPQGAVDVDRARQMLTDAVSAIRT